LGFVVIWLVVEALNDFVPIFTTSEGCNKSSEGAGHL
jgi:hypothetical protein